MKPNTRHKTPLTRAYPRAFFSAKRETQMAVDLVENITTLTHQGRAPWEPGIIGGTIQADIGDSRYLLMKTPAVGGAPVITLAKITDSGDKIEVRADRSLPPGVRIKVGELFTEAVSNIEGDLLEVPTRPLQPKTKRSGAAMLKVRAVVSKT